MKKNIFIILALLATFVFTSTKSQAQTPTTVTCPAGFYCMGQTTCASNGGSASGISCGGGNYCCYNPRVTPTSIPTATLTPSTTPSATPTVPAITNTPNPTVPVPTSCVCGADNTCDSSCPFNKVSCAADDNKCPVYAAKVSCLNENASGLTQDIKDNYCKRPYRLQGDADSDDKMDELDYFYYVRYVNGGTVPTTVNPDFNGDGVVSVTDRNIIVRTLDSIVVPTVTPENTATPSPTGNGTNPTPSSTLAPTTPQASATVTRAPTIAGGVCPLNHSCMSVFNCTRFGGSVTDTGCVSAGVPGFCCNLSK